MKKDEFRHLIYKLIIKGADISNPTRRLDLAQQWALSFLEESFSQGDEEKKRGIPVSPFCDRESSSKIGQCQVSFIDVVCKPLYTAFNEFADIHVICGQLEFNRGYWESIRKTECEAK